MATRLLLLLLAPLCAMLGASLGHQTGAPESACADMAPRHGDDAVPMETESPYTLEVDDTTVTSGGVVTVTLTGERAKFRGFLLQARWVLVGGGSDAAVGMFSAADRRAKTLDCHGRERSALTHGSAAQKAAVGALWRAPRDAHGPVQFVATVVMSFQEYWMGVTSEVVTVVTGRPDFTTGVYQLSTVLSTTSPRETTAVGDVQTSSPGVSNVSNGSNVSDATPPGEQTVAPNATATLSNASHSTGTATPLARLGTTSTQTVHVTQSTTLLTATPATVLGTVDTPSTTVAGSISSVESTIPPTTGSDSATSSLATDVTVNTSAESGLNETKVASTISASTSTEPFDDVSTSPDGGSASQPNVSTTPADAATDPQSDTSTAPFASTVSLVDISPVSSTSEFNTSTTAVPTPTPSSNTSSRTSSTLSTNAPVEVSATPRNGSSTAPVNTSLSPDDSFVTNATQSPVLTSLAETPSVENATLPMTTQNTTEMITDTTRVLETPTTQSFVPLTTTGETELITTSLAPASGSTKTVSGILTSRSTRGPSSTQTTSRSTTGSISTSESPTSASTTESRATTSGSTTESRATTSGLTTEFTTESISTEESTTPMSASSTEQQKLNPEVSTTYVITEEANEIRVTLRIVGIPFTADFNDPSSASFRSVALQVEQEVLWLYRRKGVTAVERAKVLKISRGSIVPEVQILASTDLDESTKSALLGVMYNEVSSSGRLGNLTVSDVSAVTADGTFAEVDPCFLLPCPASMVCYVYRASCLSNCYLNGDYCLNGGVCVEPSGDTQLASCRCDSRHEGVRCEVRKDPVPAPPNGGDNSNLIVAVVWGSIGSVCFVLIMIFSSWLVRYRRRKQRWRHTAKLMGNVETGAQSRAQMDSYDRRLTSIRAGVLIDMANVSGSGSEAGSAEVGRRRRRRRQQLSGAQSTSLSESESEAEAESTDQQPRVVDGGVHMGGPLPDLLPDLLRGASSTADYELDFMSRPLSQKRKSVSFSDVTEMIDFVATENFTLGNPGGAGGPGGGPGGADGNFQVRWDFQVDRSDSRESSS